MLEDQNAYDAAMTALNNGELNKENIGRLFAFQRKVSHRAINRGWEMRKDIEDMYINRWICLPLVVPKN